MTILRHHHVSEDDLLWPMLRARIPLREARINRIEPGSPHRRRAASIDEVAQPGNPEAPPRPAGEYPRLVRVRAENHA